MLGSDAHLEDDTLTVFDFDCCGPGWRAYDLATYRWIWEWYNPDGAEQHWAEFVDGYRAQRPLDEPDFAVVPLFVLLRELWLMGLHARSVDIHGQVMLDDTMLERRMAFLKTWAQRLPV